MCVWMCVCVFSLENVLCVVKCRMSNLECVARAHKYCVVEQCNVNKHMAADV